MPVVVAVDVAVVEMMSRSPMEARPSIRFEILGGLAGTILEGGVGEVLDEDFLEEKAPKTEEINEETPEGGECLLSLEGDCCSS